MELNSALATMEVDLAKNVSYPCRLFFKAVGMKRIMAAQRSKR
jgi:hypothetical protein